MARLAIYFLFLILFSLSAFAQLKVGDKAHPFSVVNQKGGMFNLSKYKNKQKVLLVFHTNDKKHPLYKMSQKQYSFIQEHVTELKNNNIEVVLITDGNIENTYYQFVNRQHQHIIVHDEQAHLRNLYQINKKAVAYLIGENSTIEGVFATQTFKLAPKPKATI